MPFALRITPIVLSFLILGAHFLRDGNLLVVALCLALPFLLLLRRPWVPYLLSAALLLGTVEWAQTLMAIASRRQMIGDPWMRMAVILGVVGLVCLLSALIPLGGAMRRRYGAGSDGGA